MIIRAVRTGIICLALAGASFAADAKEREVIFNDVRVNAHNISVIEKSYNVEFADGRYWYDPSSGLWGRENGGPEGRIAAGLHIGGPAPAAMAGSGSEPENDMDPENATDDEASAGQVGELLGGLIGLMVLGEMMDEMEQPEQEYYEEGYYDEGYYGGDAYQTGPNSYYDGQGNYEYNSRYGSGSQYSDGSWIHSSNAAGGSVGGTSDGCIYTNVGGGWSNC